MNKYVKWLTLISVALLIGAGAAALTEEYLIPTTGNIQTVGATTTWVTNGTEVTNLNWGSWPNNTEANLPDLLNITNTENQPCTLSLSYNNTSPNIIALTLSWNYTGVVLLPEDSVIVMLTLNITCSSVNFSFDIIITATQT